MSAIAHRFHLPLTLLTATVVTAPAADEVPLRLADGGHNQIEVRRPAPGTWELRTLPGGNPYVATSVSPAPYELSATPILAFEYQCPVEFDRLLVYPGMPWVPGRFVGLPKIEATAAGKGWENFALDLTSEPAVAAAKATAWRLDLGTLPGRTIRLRNLRLRPRTAAEQQLIARTVALRLADAGQQVEVRKAGADAWDVRTTGNDPYVTTQPGNAIDIAAAPILCFEYTAPQGLDTVVFHAGPPWAPERAAATPTLAAKTAWTAFSIDVSVVPAILKGAPVTAWRIDLGGMPNKTISLRNLRMRPRNAFEIQAADAAARHVGAAQDAESAVRDYLAPARDFPATVDKAATSARGITVSGTVAAGGDDLLLAEWPVWQTVAGEMRFADTWPLKAGADRGFTVNVPREAKDGHDRALSRFAVVRRAGEVDTLQSRGRWAEPATAGNAPPALAPRDKKGLAGFEADAKQLKDLDDLGISTVTINISLNELFLDTPAKGAETCTGAGRTWYLRPAAFERLDALTAAAAKRKVVVLGALLLPPAKAWPNKELGTLLQHPAYDPAGAFTMPNLTTAEGTAAYAMVIDLLARRYGRPVGNRGRIHHWIVLNEVDCGREMANCGPNGPFAYLDLYHRALRLTDLLVRRQDPNAQVLVSLSRFWGVATSPDPGHYVPRALLDGLLALSHGEGDFPWGLATHPLPSSPQATPWKDDAAAFALDSPQVTWRNLEVLDAWARLPETRYLGRPRSVHLTTMGPASADYGPQALAMQAAQAAYIWKKIAPLEAIAGFTWQGWADNRNLDQRVGLRRFADDLQDPGGPKPAWHLYKALGTKDEDAACAPFLPVVGITGWDEAQYRGEIAAPAKPAGK